MRPVHLGSVVEAGGYLAATLPYGPAQLARCLAHCARRGARVCWLPNGVGSPSLPVVRYGASEPRALLVVVGRLHACEATASYVIEGLVARFMARSRSSNAPTALVCVPFVDLPGVIAGDQGKGRRPHDHNRDFGTTSRHPETIAVRELVESLQGPIIAVDVHTPGLVGKLEERPYLVTSGDRRERQAAQAAVSWLDAELPSNGEQPGLLVFDETWNTGEAATLRSFAGWMRSRPNTWLALTFEYPNAVDRGSPVTPSTARRTGACLADWLHTVLADVAQPGTCDAPMLSLRPGSRA